MSWLHSYLKNKKISAISRPYDFASHKHFQPALSTRVITSIIGNRTLRPLDVWCSWWVSCLWSWLARSKLWPMPRNANRTSASALEASLRSSHLMQSDKICNTKCRVLKDRNHEIYVPNCAHGSPCKTMKKSIGSWFSSARSATITSATTWMIYITAMWSFKCSWLFQIASVKPQI